MIFESVCISIWSIPDGRLTAPFGWAWATTTSAGWVSYWWATALRGARPRSKTATGRIFFGGRTDRPGARLNQCQSHPFPDQPHALTVLPPPPMALPPGAGAVAPVTPFAANPCRLRRASGPPAAALRLGPLFWPWEKVQQFSLSLSSVL